MTDIDTAALREVALAASSGPWSHEPWGEQNQNGDYSGGGVYNAHGDGLFFDVADADGAFLVAAREALPALLDEVDRLRATVARVEAALPHLVALGSDITPEMERLADGGRSHVLWANLRHDLREATAALTAALTPDTKETDRG